jgi:hypothetical protein
VGWLRAQRWADGSGGWGRGSPAVPARGRACRRSRLVAAPLELPHQTRELAAVVRTPARRCHALCRHRRRRPWRQLHRRRPSRPQLTAGARGRPLSAGARVSLRPALPHLRGSAPAPQLCGDVLPALEAPLAHHCAPLDQRRQPGIVRGRPGAATRCRAAGWCLRRCCRGFVMCGFGWCGASGGWWWAGGDGARRHLQHRGVGPTAHNLDPLQLALLAPLQHLQDLRRCPSSLLARGVVLDARRLTGRLQDTQGVADGG